MPTTTPQQQSPGPYSSLINWDDELKKEEARKQQLQGSQQKIMRTNAIGEVFKLLIDSAAGTKGATINERQVNPFILSAVDRYNQLDDNYDNLRRDYTLKGLAQKEKDLGYKIGQEEQSKAWAREDQKTEEARTLAAQQAEQERLYNEQQAQQEHQRQIELEDRRAQNTRANDQHSTDQNIREYASKASIDQKNLQQTATRTSRTVPATKEDIQFIPPDGGEPIYVSPAEFSQMVWQIRQKAIAEGRGEEMIGLLRNFQSGDIVRDESLFQLIKDNWGTAKYVLSDMYGQAPPQPTRQQVEYQEYMTAMDQINSSDFREGKRVREINNLNEQYPEAAKLYQSNQRAAQFKVKPTEETNVLNIINAGELSLEQKQDAIYDYLTKKGYDTEEVRNYTEVLIRELQSIQ